MDDFICDICPRMCRARRSEHMGEGFCGAPALPRVARAALHFWEEPCISGERGSGAIFFSGCNLKCVYCQNARISKEGFGTDISVRRLSEIMSELEKEGAHNINLVTPTHYERAVIEALSAYKPGVPVVYNTGGYERLRGVEALSPYIDVFLPDLKYRSDELALSYSRAPGYFDTASKAITRMRELTGPAVYDENGLIVRGTIVRHLMLPGHADDTIGVLSWIKDNLPPGAPVSLMAQYTPMPGGPPSLARKVSRREYDRAVDFLFKNGMEDGWVQELNSSDSRFIPAFDLTGV